ncbi:MAG: hypothetical protein IJL97_03385 [Lachnospiraceae bacterium]|nr:hypothetical protein [Lachnospiraceae bacterium]
MYDKEMYERACLSPFLSFLPPEIVDKELEDGFKHNVRSIIVDPDQVDRALELRKKYPGCTTRLGITVGYPFGGMTTKTKIRQAMFAIEKGLDEIDLGININALLSDDWDAVRADLKAVKDAVAGRLDIAPVSWLVRLPLEKIDKLCELYIELGYDVLKTSAGLHFGAMKVEHVDYVYKHFGDKLSIEVAGRCRTRETAEAMREAGANYFHMSQWRRICGGEMDYAFDYEHKTGAYSPYKDRTNS